MKHLGIKIPKGGKYADSIPQSVKPKNIPTHSYPNLTLRDEQTDALSNPPKVGQTGTAKIKYRINKHEDGEYGKSTGLDITHMEDQGDELNEKDMED